MASDTRDHLQSVLPDNDRRQRQTDNGSGSGSGSRRSPEQPTRKRKRVSIACSRCRVRKSRVSSSKLALQALSNASVLCLTASNFVVRRTETKMYRLRGTRRRVRLRP